MPRTRFLNRTATSKELQKENTLFDDETNPSQDNSPLLFDRSNIHLCPWKNSPEGEYLKKFFLPLIQNDVSNYIDNVKTELRILAGDQYVFPVSINEVQEHNSYVCSPYNYYVSYGISSLEFLSKNWTKHFVKTLLWGMGKILQPLHVNKVVIVNNWFFSTNLNPPIKPDQLKQITEYLRKEFPKHAIIFRSVDQPTNLVYYQTLRQMGYKYIANRQIFYIDQKSQKELSQSRLFKSDLKLLENSGYEIIEGKDIKESEIERVVMLYRNLYLKKYSELNPQINEKFVRLAIDNDLLHFKALKKEGRIDGVIGYMQKNGKMFCPYFGYDNTLPKEWSLYRLLSTVLMLEAQKNNLFFHLSSGASTYKKIRRGSACIEYMAVDYRHLGFMRKIPWRLLKGICNSLGVFYMRRY